MKKSPYFIAVTGGIGSGKSAVIDCAKRLGFNTLSCDDLTDETYKKCKVKRYLKKNFKHAVKGVIIKKPVKSEIAKTVFKDREKLKNLTNFLAPIILAECLKRAKKMGGTVFIEVPLLFECNKADCFNSVIVVVRELEDRIKSVMERSNLSKEEVIDRINAQFDYDSADLTDYVVIKNDGDLENLNSTFISIMQEL
ncbi:MAG: dephospho-CoA kinase [Clostridia bacterium]|nr:dephospho-CoA kinase [Clostridia bacterium]